MWPSRETKRAARRPPFFASSWKFGSVRLGCRLVVGRRGRSCRGGLDAMQEVDRGLERLVVLGLRRHVGLRTGLLIAVVLEVAAQRSFALGVGARLQLIRHVL